MVMDDDEHGLAATSSKTGQHSSRSRKSGNAGATRRAQCAVLLPSDYHVKSQLFFWESYHFFPSKKEPASGCPQTGDL
eukprot:173284-Rhodomonas_salina.1